MLTKEQINALKPQAILHLNEQLPEMLKRFYDLKLTAGMKMSFPEFAVCWPFEDSMYCVNGDRDKDEGLFDATEDWLNDWLDRVEVIMTNPVGLENVLNAITKVIMTQVEVEEEEMQQC